MKKRALSIVLTLACAWVCCPQQRGGAGPGPRPASQEVTTQATPAEQDVTWKSRTRRNKTQKSKI